MPSPLDDLLTATAARIRRRELAVAGLWSLTSVAGLGLLGALVAGETLRGDLVAPVAVTLAAGSAAVLLTRAVRQTWRLAGTRHRTAQTIAQNRGPLTRGSAPGDAAGRLLAARALRREILAAVELSEAFLSGAAVGRGSPDLAAAYVAGVAARARACDPALAAPPLRASPPVRTLAGLAVLGAILVAADPALARGLALLLAAEDGRPPIPPEPLWSSLRLTLAAPPHAGRPDRAVQNPSGTLRVLAGSRVDLELTTRRPVGELHAVLVYDPSDALPEPAPERVALTAHPADDATSDAIWTGSFVVRGGGSWRLIADGDAADTTAFPFELEPDEPPEVELAPLPRSQGEPSERDSIELRFKARDDFGVASATLVFEGPEGEEIRLDAGPPPQRARTWQHRYTWDLSSVPLAERRELTYWIEVRDNDPGLGLVALPDPPGKPARSARMRLLLRDEAREHADNLDSLAALRDAAVDLLARRMQADAPDPEVPTTADEDDAVLDELPPGDAAAVRSLLRARALLASSEQLLAAIAAAIDALSVDALSPPRDAATLTAIHRRLMDLHRREAELHAAVPPGGELSRPLAGPLTRLTVINRQQVTQLEDEIIRLDDLVDDQVVAQIEQLVARVQASQQKLIDLLEKLKAGDESVRGEIDQLQQRIREDLRRLAEARARLDKEVGQEFLNLDAFEAMEAKLRQQDVSEQLRQGDVDGALDQARSSLDELRKLRDSIQERRGNASGAKQDVPQEDRDRIDLLRGLSRLQDDEVGLRSDTRALHQQWRKQAEATPLDPKLAKNLAQKAAALRKDLEAVNDARLGRDGRRALEDAREQLQHLEAEATGDPARALQSFEAAQQATRALQRASAGAGDATSERRALEQAARDARRLLEQLESAIPAPDAGLGDDDKARFDAAAERQASLRAQGQQLLDSPAAAKLQDPGKQALREAIEQMQGSGRALTQRRGSEAGDQQSGAISAIQRALDSLRQTAPPSGGAHEEASTETERDRSLRDELMDAMKEGAPDGFGREVERYYEELLR